MLARTTIRPILPVATMALAPLLAALVAALLVSPGTVVAQDQAGDHGRFLGAMETEYPEWFKESFLELEEDVKEAVESGRRLLVLFHQDGCPYCNQLVERNLAQKDIERTVREHFDVVALNMWGDREVAHVDGSVYTEKTFAAALKVQFTPTLIFFDENGRVALRLNGYIPPREFKLALAYMTGREDSRGSYRDFLARHRPPSGTGAMREEPYFARPPFVLTRTVSGSARPLAVFFEQQDCPNCETLHDGVLADPQTLELLKRFESVQLDMWSDTPVMTPDGTRTTARQWARVLKVAYAPSIVLFDGSGREVIRAEGEFKRFHSQSIMDYVLSGAYRTQPSFQRYISERAEAIRAKGIDVDIWR